MSGPVTVSAIARHPVKSMAGEQLDSVDLDARGVVGDRWYAVVDREGRLASGKDSERFRRRDEIFGYAASTVGDHVEVHGDGGSWRVGDPALDTALSTAMGAAVRVLAESGTPHQDAGPVSLVGTASLEWCREHLGVDADARRVRPNLVLETDEPFVEESWVRRTLQVGEATLEILGRIQRCRMVDIAQDSLAAQPGWLKGLGRERDLCLGIYADVVVPGRITRGDRLGATA